MTVSYSYRVVFYQGFYCSNDHIVNQIIPCSECVGGGGGFVQLNITDMPKQKKQGKAAFLDVLCFVFYCWGMFQVLL